MPALPAWLADPLSDQFAALLPPREMFVATPPWLVVHPSTATLKAWITSRTASSSAATRRPAAAVAG